ncbi:MAG: hypothetical protein IKE29_01895 [Paenibacillus sp.]|uniref:hypothetical protein n=1 Tax=Paenibacillus sp. TaxID=58172 RepID=UPI0025FBFFD0|nr:hypothetical protein [Paenibacillus sp.]MBR2563360.1 hypothetical protein [Paenibacillus sp.]
MVPPTFRKPDLTAAQVVFSRQNVSKYNIQIKPFFRSTYNARHAQTGYYYPQIAHLPCSPSVLREVIRPLIKRILTASGIPLWSCGYGVLGPVIKSRYRIPKR